MVSKQRYIEGRRVTASAPDSFCRLYGAKLHVANQYRATQSFLNVLPQELACSHHRREVKGSWYRRKGPNLFPLQKLLICVFCFISILKLKDPNVGTLTTVLFLKTILINSIKSFISTYMHQKIKRREDPAVIYHISNVCFMVLNFIVFYAFGIVHAVVSFSVCSLFLSMPIQERFSF